MTANNRMFTWTIFLSFILCAFAASKYHKFCNSQTEFACKEFPKFCISLSQVNNGEIDCPDGSDEGVVLDENDGSSRHPQAVVPIIRRGKTVMKTITKTVSKESTVTQTRTLPVNNGDPSQIAFQQQFPQQPIQPGPLFAPQYQGLYQQQFPQRFVNQYYPGLQAQPQPQHIVNRYLPYLPNGQPIIPQANGQGLQNPNLHQKVARSANTDVPIIESFVESSFGQLLSSGLEALQSDKSSSSSTIGTQTLDSAKHFDEGVIDTDKITTIYQDADTEIYEQRASEVVRDDKNNVNAVNDVNHKYGVGLKYQKRKLQQFRTLDGDFLSFDFGDVTKVPNERFETTPLIEPSITVQQRIPEQTFGSFQQFPRQQIRNPFARPAGPRRRLRPQTRPRQINQPANNFFRPVTPVRQPAQVDFGRFPNANVPVRQSPSPVTTFRRVPVTGPRRVPVNGPQRQNFNGPRRVPANRENFFGSANDFRRFPDFNRAPISPSLPVRPPPPQVQTTEVVTGPTEANVLEFESSLTFESQRNRNQEESLIDNSIPNTPKNVRGPTRLRPQGVNEEGRRRIRVRTRPGGNPRRPIVVSSVRRRPTVEPSTPAPPEIDSIEPVTTPTFGERNQINGPRRVTIRRTRPVSPDGATNLPNRRRVVTRRPNRVRTDIPSFENIESNKIDKEETDNEIEVATTTEVASTETIESSSTTPIRKVTIRRTRPVQNRGTNSGRRRVVITKSRSRSRNTEEPKVEESKDNELTPVSSSVGIEATPISALFDKPIPLTYFTTYTYFTTFVRGENTLYTSREAFFNNVVTKTLEPELVTAIKSNDGYTTKAVSDTPVYLGSRTRENIVTIVNLGSRVQVVNTDVKNAIIPTKVAQPPVAVVTEAPKQELDIETINVSDLDSVPKTYYTHFTYFYTFYDGLSTRLSAREETYSNVVTESSAITASFSSNVNNDGLLTVGPTAQIVNLGSRSVDGTTTEVNLGLQTVIKFDGISNVAIESSAVVASPSRAVDIQPTRTSEINRNQPTSTESPIVTTPFLEGSFSNIDDQVSIETPSFEVPAPSQSADDQEIDIETESVPPSALEPTSETERPPKELKSTRIVKKPVIRSKVFRPNGQFNSNGLSIVSYEPSNIVKDGTTRRRVKVTLRRPSSPKEEQSSYTRFIKPQRFEITSKPRFSVTTRPKFNNRFAKPTRRRKTLKVTRRPTASSSSPTVLYETYTTLVTVPVVFGLDTSFREALLTLTKTKTISPPTIAPTRAITLTYYTTTTYTLPVVQDDTTVFSISKDINSRVVTRTIVGSATSSQIPTSKIQPTSVTPPFDKPSVSTVVSLVNGEPFTFTYFLTSQVTDVQSASIEDQTDQVIVPSSTDGAVVSTATTSTDSLVYETVEKTVIKTEYNTFTFFATLFKGDEQIVTPIEEVQSTLVTATDTFTITKTAAPSLATPVLPIPQESSELPSDVAYTTKTEFNTVTNVVTFFQGDSTIVTSLQDVITNIVTVPVEDVKPTPSADVSLQTTVVPVVDTKTIYNTQTHFVTLFSGTETITSSITEVNSEVVTETVDFSTKFIESTVQTEPEVYSPVDIVEPFTYVPPAITATATIDGQIVTTVIPGDLTESTPELQPTSPVFVQPSASAEPEVDTVVVTYTYFNTVVEGDKTIVSSSEESSTQFITKTTELPSSSEVVSPIVTESSEKVEEVYVTRTELTTNTFTFTLFNGTSSNVITSEEVGTQYITDTIKSTVPIATTSNPVVETTESQVPSSVITLLTTYTYYTTTVTDSRTLLTSSEEVITKFITVDQPAIIPTIASTTESAVLQTTSTIETPSSDVPLTTTIGGNKVVFFPDSSVEESSQPTSEKSEISSTTTIIDDSTVVFFNSPSPKPDEASEIRSAEIFPTSTSEIFTPTTTTSSSESTATPVLKPFTSVINGATIIVFKEVYEEESSTTEEPVSSTSTEDLVSPTPIVDLVSPTSVSSSVNSISVSSAVVTESTEIADGNSTPPSVSSEEINTPSVQILTGSSVVFFSSSTVPSVETTEASSTDVLLESSVDASFNEVSSTSETPQLEDETTKPLAVPNIVKSVLESATTFVGSNGQTTSAGVSATLIFITGTDGNVLTLMPATIAPEETASQIVSSTDEVVVPTSSVVTDSSILGESVSNATVESTFDDSNNATSPATTERIAETTENVAETTESIAETTESVAETTESVAETTESELTTQITTETTEGILESTEDISTESSTVEVTEAQEVTTAEIDDSEDTSEKQTTSITGTDGADIPPEIGFVDTTTESVSEEPKPVEIKPIFLQPDLFQTFTSASSSAETTTSKTTESATKESLEIESSSTSPRSAKESVKTDVITGATTLFIDDPSIAESSKKKDESSADDSSINTSVISGQETVFFEPELGISSETEEPQPTETVLSGATTVFGGILFTRPSYELSISDEPARPAFTRPVFNPSESTPTLVPVDTNVRIVFPDQPTATESPQSVVQTQYITSTESITRTLTLSTTSIYYTKGSPLTITQFYTTTIAPRTIVSTIIGDETILGTASRSPSTEPIEADSASSYEATPLTTTVTTTTLIFNSITTTVVRTLVIPTINPTKIDLSEATEINNLQTSSRSSGGRSFDDEFNAENEIIEQSSSVPRPVLKPNNQIKVDDSEDFSNGNTNQYAGNGFDSNDIENQSKCIPGCNYANHETCKKTEGYQWKCACRPGFARSDKLRACEATQTYTVLLRVVKMKQSAIKYSTDYSNSRSSEYKDFSNKLKDGINRAYSRSQVSKNYLGADVMNLVDGKSLNNTYDGVVANFTVKVGKNAPVSENLLREELYKSLQATNYSVGGTDLYVQPFVQSIENVTDFNECSHPDFNDCANNAQCINVKGTYLCKCNEGTDDQSDPQFPGRVCSVACKFCSSHGNCYKKPDGRDGCRCYYWYLGERCEINGRVLVIVLPIILIVVLIAILLSVCYCVKKRNKKQKKRAASNMFLPYPGYVGTMDRKAMIPDSPSESSIGKGSQFTPVSSAFRVRYY